MVYASDVEYAEAIRRKEDEAITRLLEECRQDVQYKTIKSSGAYKTILVNNREDIAQETAIRVLLNIESYNRKYRFSTWRRTIGKNIFCGLLRKILRRELNFCDAPLHPDLPGIEKIIEDEKTQEPWQKLSEDEEYQTMQKKLSGGMSRLPRKQRAVVITHNLEGRTTKDTAEILKIPAGTVKSAGHAGIEKLKHLVRVA